ncbi:MAG TPA: hypothetical protein VMG63_03305 [Terriglobia bacterium]|nr:hypothetical protein [Terriglobia bacterium]
MFTASACTCHSGETPALRRWLVVSAPEHLFRVSVNGGAPQPLFEVPPLLEMLYCTNRVANFCAYPSRTRDGRSWVLTAFDPVSGKRRELLRIPTEPGARYHWGPSPTVPKSPF